MIQIEESNPSFESCHKCIHSDDSEETCILRQCIHAVAQLKECYIPKQHKTGKWIPVTKIYKVTEGQFPNTHIEWVDATEPDEIDAVRCSECREVFDFQDARNWCTECGADMREGGESDEPKRCDTCKHEKSRWFSRCADCSDYELWEEMDETGRSTTED